jgi:beta-galactosidase
MRTKLFICVWLCLLLGVICNSSGQERIVQDLSKNNWKMTLDLKAGWVNDKLFPPPVDVKSLPVNIPSGGWDMLQREDGKIVHLPATVEEYYWGSNGNPFGLAGNYLGVSWFTTKINIPSSMKGKNISLHFESVRFRAEVFINKKLAGYDLVNSTPFEINITGFVEYGKENEIEVRITDPNGNYDWADFQNFMWGDYRTIATHGFGGITGKVLLVASDNIYIDDIYVKNKPKVSEIDAELTTINNTNQNAKGILTIQIASNKDHKIVYSKNYPIKDFMPGSNKKTFTIAVDNVKLWSVDEPNLYVLKAIWKGAKTSDESSKRFGFRWFEVRDVDGDKQFYLNGKRIVLRTAISWGYWPLNGIAPSDELAKKQIESAKKIGLNMLNFHRAIGQAAVMDYADELGLLYFEEPGGYQYPANLFEPKSELGKMQTDFYFRCRREKLFRMVKRDRSHPSLIIYNLHNERGADPKLQDSTDMLDAHKLDETRIMCYNSHYGEIKQGPDQRFKLHLLPYDFKFYDYGWYDRHHADGPGVYHNYIYVNPKDYLRYFDKKDEIIYYGEEGAIGAPPRLQLIRNEIQKTGKNIGWESDAYLKWYDSYNSFLKNSGFNKTFKDVDALTIAMGNVEYYYQGRMIENIRINNITDGYAINGWECMKLQNHSGLVDNYRNPKGDVNLIARYSKPLYVAVKTNNKVAMTGDSVMVDFFIVNEADVRGDYKLAVKVMYDKQEVLNKTFPVKVSGGSVYGELLYQGFKFLTAKEGYFKIFAELKKDNKTVTSGDESIFVTDLNADGISMDGMVADTNKVISNFLTSIGIKSLKQFNGVKPEGKYLIVGEFDPPYSKRWFTDILEWVNNGNTLIVVNNVDKWANYLAEKEVLDYMGTQKLGELWFGGNYFVKNHELFSGLPQGCAFNWEYQCFSAYNRSRFGMRIFNGETIVGCVSDHKQEVYSALSIIPHGRGKIILSALDIFTCIKDLQINDESIRNINQNKTVSDLISPQKSRANIVGQRLLINMLKYASK